MVDTAATAILIVLGIVAFNNYRHGTLGTWFKAKAFNAAAPAPASFKSSSSSANSAPSGSSSSGWQVPVHGFTVTQAYGHNGHPGIDLAVPTGTPVYAANAGKVVRASMYDGYGMCVDIDHGGGVLSRYGHLQKATVAVGDQVSAGQQVAFSNNTGDSTGPHLHFEIRLNGATVDPGPYIGVSETVGTTG